MIAPGRMMRASTLRVPPPAVLWLGWFIWLPFFVPPFVLLVQARPPALLLAACSAGLAVFIALYSWSAWRNARDLSLLPPASYREKSAGRWQSAAGLAALSVLLAVLWRVGGADNFSSFIFTSAYVGGSLRPSRAIAANAGILALCVATGVPLGMPLSDVVFPVFLITVVTFVTISWVSAIVAGHEVRAAQGEISRLAASEERLRISRDLHDLLGHQLSLIALKTELARRLMESDPGKAAGEMAEVERLVRSTLQEVREAVSRYRRPSLQAELQAAREILGAAGIDYQGEWGTGVLDALPSSHEEVLAWVVREAVTNVIRHANARHCSVRVGADDGATTLEIVDDGSGSAEPGSGSGLRGITERVAGLGGQVQSRPGEGGGFAVSVRLPGTRP